jgi:thioredoxin 2
VVRAVPGDGPGLRTGRGAAGSVQRAKLDPEAEPEIAARFGIRSIPTLIAFKGGKEIARRSGASDLPGLMQWIEGHVSV